jgi:hypothetical protein
MHTVDVCRLIIQVRHTYARPIFIHQCYIYKQVMKFAVPYEMLSHHDHVVILKMKISQSVAIHPIRNSYMTVHDV